MTASLLTGLAVAFALLVLLGRELGRTRGWLDREQAQVRKLHRQRRAMNAELKLAHDRIGKLERQLAKRPAPSGRQRELALIRAHGCTKGASFLTEESALAYLRKTGKHVAWVAYPCPACRTADGETIFHVSHRVKAQRHTRNLRR